MGQLIRALIGVVIPFLYSLIVAKFPEFPIDQNTIVEFVLWIFGMLYAGSKITRYKDEKLGRPAKYE